LALLKAVYRHILLPAFAALFVFGCNSAEKALLEIDFSSAAEWKYLFGANIYGTFEVAGAGAVAADSADSAESKEKPQQEGYSGSLRAYFQGMPGEAGPKQARFGLTDITVIAPFFPEQELEDIKNRLSGLTVSVSENSLSLNDTIGIPGVMSGGWDIMRCITRVMPVMPNAEMKVGTSWDREQRFPLTVDQGKADGLLYQLFTLDSLYKTETGASAAAISWVFTYRVSLVDEAAPTSRKYPLSGTGRGTAVLDLAKKKLINSKATFEVTYSNKSTKELDEVVYFEMIE